MLTFKYALQSCCIGNRSNDADSSNGEDSCNLSFCDTTKALLLLLLLGLLLIELAVWRPPPTIALVSVSTLCPLRTYMIVQCVCILLYTNTYTHMHMHVQYTNTYHQRNFGTNDDPDSLLESR